MNEDERGITPANVTSISISRSGNLWWVIIEQGNGAVIKDIRLTDQERVSLALMLEQPAVEHMSFVDFTR